MYLSKKFDDERKKKFSIEIFTLNNSLCNKSSSYVFAHIINSSSKNEFPFFNEIESKGLIFDNTHTNIIFLIIFGLKTFLISHLFLSLHRAFVRILCVCCPRKIRRKYQPTMRSKASQVSLIKKNVRN